MNIFGAKMLPQIMPFEVALDPVLGQIGDDENRYSTRSFIIVIVLMSITDQTM